MKSRLTEWSDLSGGVRSMWELSGKAGNIDCADKLWKYITGRAEAALAAGRARRAALTDPEKVAAHAAWLRETFWRSVGGKPEGHPVTAEKTGEIRCGGYRIEKLILSPRGGAYIPANLYLPDHFAGRIPGVLVCPGHADEAKAYPEYQNVCQALVQSGVAALIFDPLGQGERCEFCHEDGFNPIHGCSGEHDHMDWQLKLAGWSLARYFAHDVESLIDYLRSRSEIDPSKIAVTGNSGGGTMSYMAMMTCFDRLAAAAPCSYNTSEAAMLHQACDYDNEQVWPGMLGMGVDYADQLICMAGKPVLLLLNRYDFFPYCGAMETLETIRPFWKLMGSENNLACARSETEHEYARSLAAALSRFLTEKLCGEARTPADSFVRRAPGELFVTARGQIALEKADYVTVRACLRGRLDELEQIRAAVTPDRRRAYIREMALGRRTTTPTYAKLLEEGTIDDIRYGKYVWLSVDGLYSSALIFENLRKEPTETVIALWPEGTDALTAHARLIRRWTAAGRRVMVLDVAGVGGQKPASLAGSGYHPGWGTKFRIGEQLIRLGDSLAAIRIAEAVRAVDMLREFGWDNARYYGESEFSQTAALAAEASGLPCELAGERITLDDIARAEYYDNTYWEAWSLPGILEYLNV